MITHWLKIFQFGNINYFKKEKKKYFSLMQKISHDRFVAALDELVCVFYNPNSMCCFFCSFGFLLMCEPKASIFLCITKKVQKRKSCLIYLCLFQYLLWSTKGVQPRDVHQCYEEMLITGSLVNLVIKFSQQRMKFLNNLFRVSDDLTISNEA